MITLASIEPVRFVVLRVADATVSYTPSPKPPAPESPRDRLDGVQILVAEDDLDLLEALASYLEGAGAVVHRVSSVAAGLATLTSARLDLLISDVGLPDGSGHTLASAARSLGVAALALTGGPLVAGEREEAMDQARSAGFQMYLIKPCDPSTLVRTAQLLLAREN